MTTYRGRNGSRYALGKKIGHGGEGDVYEIQGRPGMVAKLYSQKKFQSLASVVADPRGFLYNKIMCMLNSPVDGYTYNKQGKRVLTVAWPQDILLDDKGLFVGFTMPSVTSRYSIHTAYRVKERPLLFKNYTWKSAIAIAYNLASAVAYLHRQDIVIGDFNSNNILIDKHGIVTLIDSDSFNVTDSKSGKVYKCMVGVPEVLAPELQGKNLSQETSVFTKESDCFSLAVHVFTALMENYHPFGCDGIANRHTSSAMNPVALSIAQGACPYVSGSQMAGQQGAPDINMLPQEIRDLIDRTFSYTAKTAVRTDTIQNRPSAREWMDALARLYSSQLSTCGKNKSHVYLSSYGHCPWCDIVTPTPTPSSNTWSSSASGTSPFAYTSFASRNTRRRRLWNMRPTRPLWVVCILVGIATGPLLAGPLRGLLLLTGMLVTPLDGALVLSVVGAVIGCLVAFFVQNDYQKADTAWPWFLVSLLIPLLVFVTVAIGMQLTVATVMAALVGAGVATFVCKNW